MGNQISFFTPVSFGSQSGPLSEKIDNYFYLGGKKAYVIPGHVEQGSEDVILTPGQSSFLTTALKIVSYFTLIIPALMLIAKAALRYSHSFYIIDVQAKVEEGINISEVTARKIQELMPKIRRREEDGEIVWHSSGNNLVFGLTSVPNLVFKMARPGVGILGAGGYLSSEDITESRFANMVKAKEVCLVHQLGLLLIPHAKKFTVDGMSLIAEECVDIHQNESAQEHFYQLSGLNETARQLATFIAKTGFSDVEWRNMPVVDTAPEFQGSRRIALIDLEEMDSASTGIFGGGFGRRGLVSCLHSEEQIDLVLAEARKLGVNPRYRTTEGVREHRVEEIRSDRAMHEFYQRNGILENPRKPIQVLDLESLGLDLDESAEMRTGRRLKTGSGDDWDFEWETTQVTMRKAIIDVIAAINAAIQETPEEASLKGKRYIRLDHNSNEPETFFLKEYDRLGCKQFGFVSDEELNQRWLKRIVDALAEKGHIFKLDKQNNYGYFIQA